MKANEALGKIPVVTRSKPRDGLAWKRRAVQWGFVLALILIPITGVFRVDLSAGFIVLGRQIWFADFAIVFGFWLTIACSFILLYSTVGTAFCGWACPQNTFSSLADTLTSKLLGKRAVIDWEQPDTSKIAQHKNKIVNWIVLGTLIWLASMVISIIPLLYFITPADALDFVTFSSTNENTYSLRWIYFVFVFIAFVNFAVVRHYVCRYMCIYRMWQYLFKTRQTLHINYDESRAADCEKCNYCLTKCMVDIDPRRTNMFDSCTNCGACITACNTIHAKQNVPGLLSFKIGERKNKIQSNALIRLANFKERLGWVLPVWILGVSIFSWGLWTYDPFHLAAYKSDVHQGDQISEYRINVANKSFDHTRVFLTVEGLDSSSYDLSAKELALSSLARGDSFIRIRNNLPPGMHSFIVRVQAESGWNSFVRLQHFVING